MRLSVLTCLVAGLAWAGPVFTDLAPSTVPTPGRRSTGLAVRGQGAAETMIIFGGFTGAASPSAELWFYTTVGNAWATATSTTAGRERHGLALDLVRDRVVIFGGINGGLLNTLTLVDGFSLAQSTPAAAAGVPSTRADPLVEYIPPWGKFLVFGGRRSLIANNFVQDNYSLDIADGGVTWATVTSATLPSARGASCHAWDPVRSQVIMFGGEASNDLGDTWAFTPDGGGWKSLTVSGSPPSARSFAACAWEPNLGRFVLYGGQSVNSQVGGLYTFDPATNTWTQETVGATNPGPLSDSSAVYSTQLGGVVLFGGNTPSGYTNKTWLVKFNAPPVVDAGANFTVNEAAASALSGSVTDPDGDPTTVSWSQTLGPAVTLSSTSVLAPTFTAPRVFTNTTLRFVLTGSDLSSSSSASVDVTVLNTINEAPTADAGPDQSAMIGSTVTLSGSGSDPNNDPIVTYAWSQVSGATATLSSSSVPSPTFTAPNGTTLTFQLIVNDGNLASAPDQVVVTLTPAAIDAGSPDAGAAGPDAGTVDAGAVDAGAVDAGAVDAGTFDAGMIDDGGVDAGGLDAGVADAGDLDAGAVDGGDVDAGSSDAGVLVPDAGSDVDAGPPVPPRVYTVGCDCQTASVPVAWLWLLGAWWFRRARRPF